MTITAKARKEEILQAYQELETEHEQLKHQIVDTAMDLAKKHDWCNVVRVGLTRVGLSELLPPRVVIQWKTSASQGWSAYEEGYDSVQEAQKKAKQYRKDNLETQKREWDRSMVVAEQGYIYFNSLEELKDVQAKIAAALDPEVPKPEFVEPKYPQFRVVVWENKKRRVVTPQ